MQEEFIYELAPLGISSFSIQQTEEDDLYTEEVLDGKRIFTHIILTNVARPSKLPVPDKVKEVICQNFACMLVLATIEIAMFSVKT